MSTAPGAALPNIETGAAWKQEVNDRLAAHRTRRPRRGEEHPTLPGLDHAAAGEPSKSSIAAKVAARYAKAPTYSEMLAAEAQNAADAAAAAARAASQAHAAAQAILTGLDIRPDTPSLEKTLPSGTAKEQSKVELARSSELSGAGRGDDGAQQEGAGRRDTRDRNEQPSETSRATRRDRRRETGSETRSEMRREAWQDTVSTTASMASLPDNTAGVTFPAQSAAPAAANSELRITLAEEESGAVAVYETTPAQPIHANLIEFPRELFATRRARPRLAEGPLRDEAFAGTEQSQLRIFEVAPESISTTASLEQSRAEWSSIRLGVHPAYEVEEPEHAPPAGARQSAREVHAAPSSQISTLQVPLQTASLEDRAMAAIVDFALVAAAFLLFVLSFAACAAHLPSGKPALIAGALAFLAVALVYQLLFFRYAESTPGMRYAKIALCTFDDENPSRRQLRIRVASMLLSLCPLGLGCAWVLFDEDRLSWHDRITRTYQRSYR